MTIKEIEELARKLERYVEPKYRCPVCKKEYYVYWPPGADRLEGVPQCEKCMVTLGESE